MSLFTENYREEIPEEGPKYSAQDYASAFHEIMASKNPSEQMKAVNTLSNISDTEAFQSIIDTMNEDDFEIFTKLQTSILDGTYDTMNEILEYEKRKNEEDANEPSRLLILMNVILFSIPNPEEIIEKINSKLSEKTNKMKTTAEGIKSTVSQGISDSINYVKNTFDNIKWFVEAVLSNNEISDDYKEKLIKYIYDNKGYLLLTYDESNKEFVYDRVMDDLLITKAIENSKKKKNNVQGTEELSSSQPEEKWEENILKELQPLLERTQSLPKDMEFSEFITKARKRYFNIKQKVQALYPAGLYPTPVNSKLRYFQNKANKEAKNANNKMTYMRKSNPGPKPPIITTDKGKGGKTRRKVRRNKKAKTKKRKVNKKTKKMKMKMKMKSKRKTNKRRNKK